MNRPRFVIMWVGIVGVSAALLYPIVQAAKDDTLIRQDTLIDLDMKTPGGEPITFFLPNVHDFSTQLGIYTIVAGLVTGGLWLTLRPRLKKV